MLSPVPLNQIVVAAVHRLLPKSAVQDPGFGHLHNLARLGSPSLQVILAGEKMPKDTAVPTTCKELGSSHAISRANLFLRRLDPMLRLDSARLRFQVHWR